MASFPSPPPSTSSPPSFPDEHHHPSASAVADDKEPPLVIIGTGPCGLGAAYRLQELGIDNFVVLEAGPVAGGLSITATDEQGFLWDMGGHVIFSHYHYFDALLDKVNSDWCERQRVCYIWQKGRFIPYPYQNNIHRLPPQDFQRCMDGLNELEAHKKQRQQQQQQQQQQHFSSSTPPPPRKPRNFLEWLQNGFGEGILDLFMVPYNRKVWGYEPSEMNTEWMGERVATVDLARLTTHIQSGKNDASWGPNNTFRFPLRGGTGRIWQKVYERINPKNFRFNARVVGVDADASVVMLAGGEEVKYKHLISTMPIDRLCCLVKGEGLEGLPAQAPRFRYSSTHVVGIGLEGQPPEHLKGQCWMYFPEEDCPFYRVTVFSNYSPYHVPEPGRQWSLMAEVCETRNRPVDSSRIVEEVLEGFYATKLLKRERDRVGSRFHRRLEYGYPTPFLGREEVCGPILEALERKGIWSRGRFGGWKYEVSNQDHTMMQGVECVDHLVGGREEEEEVEVTFRTPGRINSREWGKGGLRIEEGRRDMRYFDPLVLTRLLREGMSMEEAEAVVLRMKAKKEEEEKEEEEEEQQQVWMGGKVGDDKGKINEHEKLGDSLGKKKEGAERGAVVEEEEEEEGGGRKSRLRLSGRCASREETGMK